MGIDPITAYNAISGAIPMVVSLYDRARMQSDPFLKQVELMRRGQYNELTGAGPYGDPYSGWSNLFGGTGFGQANAYTLANMLNIDPTQAYANNLMALSGQYGPTMTDATSGLAGLLGRSGVGDYATQGMNMGFIPGHTEMNFAGYPSIQQDRTDWQVPPDFNNFSLLQQYFNMMGGGQNQGGTGTAAPAQTAFDPWASMVSQYNQIPGTPGFANSGQLQVRQPATMPVPSGQGGASILSALQQLFGGGAGNSASQNAAGGTKQLTAGVTPQAKAMALPASNLGGFSAAPSFTGGTAASLPKSAVAAAPMGAFQTLMGNWEPMGAGVQRSMLERGTENINAQANAQARNMRNQMPAGVLGTGAAQRGLWDLNMQRSQDITNLGRDIGIEAAKQNFAGLTQAAGLQFGAEQALANQLAQQNAARQSAFDTNQQRLAGYAGMLGQASTMEQQRQMELFNQLRQLAQEGIAFTEQPLTQALQMRYGMLSPGSVQPVTPLQYKPETGGGGGSNPFESILGALGQAGGSYFGAKAGSKALETAAAAAPLIFL